MVLMGNNNYFSNIFNSIGRLIAGFMALDFLSDVSGFSEGDIAFMSAMRDNNDEDFSSEYDSDDDDYDSYEQWEEEQDF